MKEAAEVINLPQTDTCTCCRDGETPQHLQTSLTQRKSASPISFFGKISGLLLPTSPARIKKTAFINSNKSTWQEAAVKNACWRWKIKGRRAGDVFAFEKPSRRIPRKVFSQGTNKETLEFF